MAVSRHMAMHTRILLLAAFAGLLAIDDPHQKYQPKNDAERAAMEAFRGARLVELPGARHYIFLSNEEEVLKEMRTFPPPSANNRAKAREGDHNRRSPIDEHP